MTFANTKESRQCQTKKASNVSNFKSHRKLDYELLQLFHKVNESLMKGNRLDEKEIIQF